MSIKQSKTTFPTLKTPETNTTIPFGIICVYWLLNIKKNTSIAASYYNMILSYIYMISTYIYIATDFQ